MSDNKYYLDLANELLLTKSKGMMIAMYIEAIKRLDKAIEYINKEENMKLFKGAFGYGEFIGALEDILEGDK